MMINKIIGRVPGCYGSTGDFNAKSGERCPRYLKQYTEYGVLFLIIYFFSSGFAFTFFFNA